MVHEKLEESRMFPEENRHRTPKANRSVVDEIIFYLGFFVFSRQLGFQMSKSDLFQNGNRLYQTKDRPSFLFFVIEELFRQKRSAGSFKLFTE